MGKTGIIYAPCTFLFKIIPEMTLHKTNGGPVGIYLEVLATVQAKTSTSQNSDPLENVIAERINGILKMELLYQHFPNFEQAAKAISDAVKLTIYPPFRLIRRKEN